MYDYLIVGAGLFGSTFAWNARRAGKKVLVVDVRDHVGGNCYTQDVDGINIHVHGPHIFHTSDKVIWDFVNKFATFLPYTHRVKALNGNRVYSMPINMMTLHQIWGVKTPAEAAERISAAKKQIKRPKNLEEWILSQVGSEIYETLIKGYTTKQWGRLPSTLPASIIKRLPIRLTWDDNYFDDLYQGIPAGGYTRIFQQLLEGCDVQLGVDFLKNRAALEAMSHRTVYTGQIDSFYDHCYGNLEYRTLEFETKRYEVENYQGLAQLNYASTDVPWTRSVEHKHFENSKTSHTIVTWEKSGTWTPGAQPYYPINDDKNNTIYALYQKLAIRERRTVFGGRLASYKYRDMHQIIAEAMTLAKKESVCALA